MEPPSATARVVDGGLRGLGLHAERRGHPHDHLAKRFSLPIDKIVR